MSTSRGQGAGAARLPGVEVVLSVVAIVGYFVLPLATLLAPPVVMLDHKRLHPVAALLYAGAVAGVAGRFLALDANMDWADRTGGGGSILAGWYWLILAVLLALASVLVTLAKRRPGPAQ
jgi:hypothetical protein